MSRLQSITTADFATEVLSSGTPVVVDVYADWCRPCRALAPVLEQCAGRYGGELKFVKVNLDDSPEVAEVYRVEAVPTLLFFRNGQLADRVTGIPPAQELLTRLDNLAGRRGTRQTAARPGCCG